MEGNLVLNRLHNHPAIFVTNHPDGKYGSSLYLVHANGTIRCSGASYKDRSPTLFIRPYLIGYFQSDEKRLYSIASVELYPFEGNAENYLALYRLNKDGWGHHGNKITELISMSDLEDPNFTPKTWHGVEKNGTDWQVARLEVLQAYSLLADIDYNFTPSEYLVNRVN